MSQELYLKFFSKLLTVDDPAILTQKILHELDSFSEIELNEFKKKFISSQMSKEVIFKAAPKLCLQLNTLIQIAENRLKANHIKCMAVNWVLFLLDSWLFSGLSWVARLKKIITEQKELIDYCAHLNHFKNQVERFQGKSETQANKLFELNECSFEYLHVFQKNMQDFSEKITHYFFNDSAQRVHWKSNHTLFILKISLILDTLQTLHLMNIKNISIEAVDRVLKKLHIELTSLNQSEYEFSGKVGQHPQTKLTPCRSNSHIIFTLLMCLNDVDMPSSMKKRYLLDLIMDNARFTEECQKKFTEESCVVPRDLTENFKKRRGEKRKKKKKQPPHNESPLITNPFKVVPKSDNKTLILKSEGHISEVSRACEKYNALYTLALETENFYVTTDAGETILHLAVATGQLALVESVFQKQKELLNTKNRILSTPLEAAIDLSNVCEITSKGYIEIAKYLVSQGANIGGPHFCSLSSEHQDVIMGYQERRDALLIAVKNSNSDEVVKFFNDVNQQLKKLSHSTASVKVYQLRYIECEITRLINAQDENGQTLLQQLVAREQARQLILLIKKITPSQKEIRERDKKIVKVLMQYAEKVENKSLENIGIYELLESPYVQLDELKLSKKTKKLAVFAKKLKQKVVQVMRKITIKPETIIEIYQQSKDIFDDELDRNTQGAQSGRYGIIKMNAWILQQGNLKKDDIVTCVDQNRNTLLHLAVQDNMNCIVQWLLPKTINEKLENFLEGIKQSASAVLNFVLEKGMLLGTKQLTHRVVDLVAPLVVGGSVTALTAVFLGPFSIPLGILAGKAVSSAINLVTEKSCELFIERAFSDQKAPDPPPAYPDVNAKNNTGDTVLHIATRDLEKFWMVLAFLQAGADINQKNAAGETCLHTSVRAGNLAVVEVLLHLDGKNIIRKNLINDQNIAGETPLHIAVKNGDYKVVTLLSKLCADWTIKTVLQQTPADLVNIKIALINHKLHRFSESGKKWLWENLNEQRKIYQAMQNQYLGLDSGNAENILYPSPLHHQAKQPSALLTKGHIVNARDIEPVYNI